MTKYYLLVSLIAGFITAFKETNPQPEVITELVRG
ncbi:hypothetical protein SLEP1_g44366 [Rubroshorea leprosula]|uniref:Uncharacterized protein n=1 Tax=Rubroshorea leprosula TaxID=152421 RepID=A0AAV5LG03_9ROSI|nr:hypothetical protein SLEP1_g44366 [Rubroshorea leprosula]